MLEQEIPQKELGQEADFQQTSQQPQDNLPYSSPELTKTRSPEAYIRPRPWYERWEYEDNKRIPMRFNSNVNRAIRVKSAAGAFSRRYWPFNDTALWEQWEQIQIFLGLQLIIPIWHTRAQHEAALAAQSAQDALNSSDESDFGDNFPRSSAATNALELDHDENLAVQIESDLVPVASDVANPREFDHEETTHNTDPVDLQVDTSPGHYRGPKPATSGIGSFDNSAYLRACGQGRGRGQFRGRGRGRGDYAGTRGSRAPAFKKQLKTRPPYHGWGVLSPPVVDSQEEIQHLFRLAKDDQEDRLIEFMNDPAGRVREYLGSWMRRECMNLTEKNIYTPPLLLKFFITFLLKHDVFSGEHEEVTVPIPDFKIAVQSDFDSSRLDVKTSLELALQITLFAIEELPLISKATKALTSETFGVVCRELFGVNSSALDGNHCSAFIDQERTEQQEQEHNAEMLKANLICVSPSSGEPRRAYKPAIESVSDHDDADSIENIDNIANVTDTSTTFRDIEAFGTSLDPAAWNVDNFFAMQTISSLLGPLGSTVLASIPRTHRVGVIERSIRRIREIVYHSKVVDGSGFRGPVIIEPELDANSVENLISTKLVKVILDPWIGWETREAEPGLFEPKILSSGATDATTNEVPYLSAPNDLPGTPVNTEKKEHDPHHDSITVLLEPDCASSLRAGMGLGGVWVEMARVCASASSCCVDSGEPAADQHKEVFWYMAEMKVVVASYYTGK